MLCRFPTPGLNHRLKLSIAGTAGEVGLSDIQHFRSFMDKLYSLYSQFPQNARELEEHAKKIRRTYSKDRKDGYLMLDGLQVHSKQCLLRGMIMRLFACILNQQVKMQEDQNVIKLRF